MKNEAPGMEVVRKIVTGDFHPSLEEALLDHLALRARHAPLSETPVIVPTNLLGLRISRALASRIGGHANVRFMTLVDFAASAAPVPLPRGPALLPRRGDEIVVRRLIDDGLAAEGYFEAIADRPGLSNAILAAIRDLKEASYDPDSFEAAARAAGLGARGRRNKCAELARIWRAYEESLAEGRWIDRLDLMREAALAVEAGPDPAAPLTVYGFYDLNPLQKRLVAACAERTDTVVFFPFVDTASFDYARPTLDWFLSLGFRQEEAGDADLRTILLPKDTIIISAPGEAREAREDTRALVRLLEERDLSFQDVTVVARSPHVYSDLFAEEFERLGARAYIEAPPPLSRTRTGRSLVKLALVVGADFGRSDLIEFLSLADVELPGAPREAPVSDWNKATILAGITSGGEAWLPALGTLLARIERASPGDRFALKHADLSEAISSLVTLLPGLIGELSGLASRATVKQYLTHLLRVFESITRQSDERSLVVGEARKLLAVSDIAGPIGFSYFTELLRSHLDAGAPRRERFGGGGPTVLNIMSSRGLRSPVAVVPGLVEREFPLRRRQDPILLDGERARLNESKGGDPLRALPLRAAGVDEERLLFRLAVRTATDALILSFPRLDPANARPRVASAFLLSALEELTGKRHDYEALEASERVRRIPLSRRFPASRSEALTREEFDGCSILRAVASGSPEEIAYIVHAAGPLPRRLDMEQTRWGRPFFTRYDGVLRSKDALAAASELSGFTREGRPGETVSATALEEYATCPFRFFMHHVLGLDPAEEPEEALELSPLERGKLYHDVLEGFFRRLASDGDLPVRPESRDLLFSTSERLVQEGPWHLAGYEGARLLVLQELLSDLALWFVDELSDDSGLTPSYFETRFGGEIRDRDDSDLSTEDGVPFDALGDVRVEFGGRIDRIDVSPDGSRARVIDYKSGVDPGKKKRVIYRGKRLQLPIYLMAARAMLVARRPGIDVESAEYRYVAARGGPASLALSRALLDERADDLRSAVGLIIREGIGSGMFFPYPEDRGCRNCDYAEACSSASVALARMKNGDRTAEFYTSVLAGID